MRILVLASEAVDAARVRSVLPGEQLDGAEVLVVAPAEQKSTLKFLMSDADDAIAAAGERGDEAAAGLRDAGAHVRSETGEHDPLLAIQDAMATFPADRILIFGDTELAEQVRAKFGVEVSAV